MAMLREYMDKLKASANQLVAEKREETEDTAVYLEPRDHALLKTWADRDNMTVKALVDRAIRQYIISQTGEGTVQIPVERKEKNPLLHLDGLTQNIQ